MTQHCDRGRDSLPAGQMLASSITLLLLSALLSVGVVAQPVTTPSLADVTRGLDSRFGSAERISVLIGKLSFVDMERPGGQPVLWPAQASSVSYRRDGDALRYHAIYCLPDADAMRRPGGLNAEFVYQDFERRYVASIRQIELPVHGNLQIQNVVDTPQDHESWVPYVLGLSGANRSLAAALSGEARIVGWEDHGGIACVRVDDRQTSWWFAPELGFAPIRKLVSATTPGGAQQETEVRWLDFRPAPGAELLALPRRRTNLVRERTARDGAEDPPWRCASLIVYAIASVQVNDAVTEQPWPASVPLLVGGWFQNHITGLPEQPTTVGYSIDQLRRALWEDEQPFGLDLPEIHELRAYQAELAAQAEAEAEDEG